MNSVSKFVKKNKVLVVVGAVVLLAIILAPSLYYGLKKSPASNPTSSPASNPTSSPTGQMVTFSDILKSNQSAMIDLSKYKTDEIEIRITGFKYSNFPSTRNFMELVRLISSVSSNKGENKINQLVFGEIMNIDEHAVMINFMRDGAIGMTSEKLVHDPYPENDLLNITITIKKIDEQRNRYTYTVDDVLKNIFNDEIEINYINSSRNILNDLRALIIDCSPSIGGDGNDLNRDKDVFSYQVRFINSP